MNASNFKKVLVLLLILFFINSSLISSGFSNSLKNYKFDTCIINNEKQGPIYFQNGNTLYVGGTGPGNYSNIHDAIDDAKNGDTIFVYNGSYPSEIFIDKSVILLGEDRDNTIIEGGQDGFWIQADNVKITSFTIRNCGEFWNHCAIYIGTNDNTITNNKIIDNGKLNGIFLQDSNNNIISNNIIENNPYHAIRMEYSNYNSFTNNYVYDNEGDGLFMVESSNNHFEFNTILSNFWGGITVDEFSVNNKFYHNFLIDNGQNANDNGYNIWNDSYPAGGNYWSDYSGVDQFQGPNQDIPGSDGIGDIPYDLPCEHAIDWYPLMSPNNAPYVPVISGQTHGQVGVEYVYNFFIDDSEKDNVYLRVDWGTDGPGKWHGPFSSETDVMLNHTWTETGTYWIRAQAKDINNLEGPWGELYVIMPKNRLHAFVFNNRLFNLYSIIQNKLDLCKKILNLLFE